MLPILLDKFAMKNPSTANCRIYLGNLPDDSTQDELYEMFNKHGTVIGILLNKGFGFIQFQNENDVTEAITNEHGAVYHGRNLIVRPAQANPDKAKQSFSLEGANASTPTVQDTKAVQDRPNNNEAESFDEESVQDEIEERGGFNNNRNWNRGGERGSRGGERGGRGGDRGGERGGRGGDRGGRGGERGGRGGERGLRGGERGGRGGRNNQRDGGGNFRDRSPPARDWNQRGFDRYPTDTFAPDRNDCEIIVVSKALTEYAEYIEDRLKRHGITVDLLFPKEDVPIGRVLGNIHSRGCLYAILIMPQNEEYRSLTLNILHGLPQEHRHMPLEDALTLISRNFAEYRSGTNSISSREAMLALLGQLAEGRSLTVLQYDRVLDHLKEKREQQVKVELGNAAEPSKEVAQNDLQQMILSMLNNETPARAPQNKPTEVSDPTVQKALDSFLQKLV